jgi:hypothetical protein
VTIQALIFGRYFQTDEQSESVTLRKITHSMGCQLKYSRFEAQIEILENWYLSVRMWQLLNT